MVRQRPSARRRRPARNAQDPAAHQHRGRTPHRASPFGRSRATTGTRQPSPLGQGIGGPRGLGQWGSIDVVRGADQVEGRFDEAEVQAVCRPGSAAPLIADEKPPAGEDFWFKAASIRRSASGPDRAAGSARDVEDLLRTRRRGVPRHTPTHRHDRVQALDAHPLAPGVGEAPGRDPDQARPRRGATCSICGPTPTTAARPWPSRWPTN